MEKNDKIEIIIKKSQTMTAYDYALHYNIIGTGTEFTLTNFNHPKYVIDIMAKIEFVEQNVNTN